MTCGSGTRKSMRNCTQPPFPEMRDKFCNGNDVQFTSCNEGNCPSMKALVLILNHAQVNNVVVLSATCAGFLSPHFTYSSRN